jgi:hypothetical protein
MCGHRAWLLLSVVFYASENHNPLCVGTGKLRLTLIHLFACLIYLVVMAGTMLLVTIVRLGFVLMFVLARCATT